MRNVMSTALGVGIGHAVSHTLMSAMSPAEQQQAVQVRPWACWGSGVVAPVLFSPAAADLTHVRQCSAGPKCRNRRRAAAVVFKPFLCNCEALQRGSVGCRDLLFFSLKKANAKVRVRFPIDVKLFAFPHGLRSSMAGLCPYLP